MKKTKPKPLLFVFIFILIVGFGCFFGWNYFTGPVDKNNSQEIEVEIPAGTNSREIGKILTEKKLIHNELIFKVYLKINHVNSLKAATYLLRQDMSLEEIISELEDGSTYNPNMIRLTFKEGIRITDYAKVIGEGTNHTEEEFITLMKNREYIKTLIPDYWFLTDEVLNTNIYYPLEGYLAPDTYHFDDRDVELDDIVQTMLKQTDKNLKTYREKMEEKPHYYFTMASIVELEGTNTENKEMIVGIFENRLANGMNMGSDVTTYYSLQLPMTSDLTVEQFNTVNAYNTRSATMIGRMPAGPICNPGKGSIAASVNPTKNDYFYFVADKNGKIYYTKTAKEHADKVAEIKAKGDWIW